MPIIPPPIPVKVERVDTCTIVATLNQSQIEWLVAKHVAQVQNLRLGDKGVSYRVEGGTIREDCVVTIVQDFSKMPKVADPSI